MAQSLSQIYLHNVFSTKGRQPFLADRDLRARAHAYLAGICRDQDSPAVVVGGAEEHAHILCRLSRNVAVAVLVREVKRASSLWARKRVGAFQWQAGYGAFSISPQQLDELVAYISRQEEHHQAETFQAEFLRLLQAHGVEWDERYVWD